MKGKIILTTLILLNILFLNAQEQKTKKSQTVIIQTSSQCEKCKECIESKLNYVKGITFAELDVESSKLTVKFKTKKITLEEIKKIISEIGYDADEIKANPESQKKLPLCCQPGGMK